MSAAQVHICQEQPNKQEQGDLDCHAHVSTRTTFCELDSAKRQPALNSAEKRLILTHRAKSIAGYNVVDGTRASGAMVAL